MLNVMWLIVNVHFFVAYIAEKSYLCTRKCGKIWLLATTRKNAKIAIQSCSPRAPVGVCGTQAGRPHCRPISAGAALRIFY